MRARGHLRGAAQRALPRRTGLVAAVAGGGLLTGAAAATVPAQEFVAVLVGLTSVAPAFAVPSAAVMAAVAVQPLDYPSHLVGMGSRTFFEVVVALAAVATATAWLLRRPQAGEPGRLRCRLGAAVGLWLLMMVLQFLRDPRIDLDPTVLHSPGKILYRTVVGVLVFGLVVTTVGSRARLVWAMRAFLAGAVVSMGWGTYLGITRTPVTAYDGGLISQATPDGWRVGSTFDGPFPLALQAAIALAACLSYLLFSEERRWRLPAVLLAALSVAAIVATQLRAGWIAAALVVVLLALATPHRRRALALIGPAVAVAVGIAAIGVASRLYQFHDVSAQTRLALWRFSAGIFLNSPVFGSGPSTFVLQYQQSYNDFLQVGVVSAHSTIASVAVELGLVGLVLFLAQYVLSVHTAWATWSRARGDWLTAWPLASVAAIAPFLLTEDIYLIRDITYLFYLVLGLTVAASLLPAGARREAR